MKILIADKVSAKMVADLQSLGCEVALEPDLSAEALPAALAGVEILIVRSKQVTAAAIEAGSSLSLIIRAGAGVNTIDIKKASEKGIYVANCPGKNTDAVAELAIGLLIAADRRIPDALLDLRAGKWRKKEYGKARGLKGRTLGIVGLGSIGCAVARRAQDALKRETADAARSARVGQRCACIVGAPEGMPAHGFDHRVAVVSSGKARSNADDDGRVRDARAEVALG